MARPFGLLDRLGVRGRLLLAFFGISALAVVGATAALYSFGKISEALALITQRRVPAAIQSQELAGHAERIVAAAPALLSSASQQEKDVWSRSIHSEVAVLSALLDELETSGLDRNVLESFEVNVARLRANLEELDQQVNSRLVEVEQKRELLRKAISLATEAQSLLAPWVSVMDERIAQWRQSATNSGVTGERREEIDREFEKSLSWFRALQASEVLSSSISDLLQRGAAADDNNSASVSGFRLQQQLNELERLAKAFDPRLQSLMLATIAQLRPFVSGDASIVALRRRELSFTANGTRLLAENKALSKELTDSVSRLVASSRTEISSANADAQRIVRLSTAALIVAVMLSLISSTLIVWLYVGRNIIARLTALSERMLTLAASDLHSPLPSGGSDEIGRMAESLAVFRATAVEMEKTNLREIREARMRLTEAIEAISEGFSLYDADDQLVVCNTRYKELFPNMGDQLMPGTSFETIVKSAIQHGLIVDAKANPDEWYKERLERHLDPSAPHLQRRADGRWVRISERRTANGGIVATYADISELKQREGELANLVHELEVARDAANEASRTKSSFLANMSHELRTPLNAIIGVTEILHEDAKELGRDDEIAPLDRVLRAARHLLALINDILDLSKIEAGRMELHLEEFKVAPVIEDVVSTIETMAAKNSNLVTIDCSPDVGAMQADQIRVRQALLNLVSNANKFTQGGNIAINAGRKKANGRDWIVISVVDTGIGMSSEQVGRLFQDFAQADSSTTRKYGGTGLGLAISRRFCQMMGGDISVVSELGRGSTFTFNLPATAGSSEAGAKSDPTMSIATRRDPSGKTPLVLVVDDDAATRDIITHYLEREGFRVAQASGGQEGLASIRELRPDAVTLDIMMPELDGWTVLAAVKGDPELADTPIVLMTIVDDRRRGFALGAADYLVKPVNRDKLISTLRRIAPSHGKVLIIDDDPGVRQQLRSALDRDGWTTSEAENGRDALEKLAKDLPDAIVLDLMMPEMDGFELMEALRADDRLQVLPVVVVTAREVSAADRARFSSGVQRIILKSATDDMLGELRAALAKCLQQRAVDEPAEV